MSELPETITADILIREALIYYAIVQFKPGIPTYSDLVSQKTDIASIINAGLIGLRELKIDFNPDILFEAFLKGKSQFGIKAFDSLSSAIEGSAIREGLYGMTRRPGSGQIHQIYDLGYQIGANLRSAGITDMFRQS